MNNFDNEIYSIWRPDLGRIVQNAIEQKSPVTVESHFPLDECNSADVTLYGRFIAINNGHLAQYVVETQDFGLTSVFLRPPACTYSFSVDMPVNEGGKGRIEYSGRAVIIDQELQKNNLPESLLMRVSSPSRIRPLRRYHRQNCSEEQIIMPGLVLIDREPQKKHALLNLLGRYYQQKTRPRPRIINISAGGVCLSTEDHRCQRFMGAEESYLFFFFTKEGESPGCPIVLLGKKVGIFRGENTRHSGLRIRFVREMVWTEMEENLKWNDIGAEGSENIRKLMSGWGTT